MSAVMHRVSDKASDVVMRGDAPLRASNLPAPLRFPLVVLLSLITSSLLHNVAAEYTRGELASVSRSLNEWWEVAVLIGLKTFELAIGWYMKYDSYDLAALILLSHGPPLYLLNTFYNIRTSTVLISLLIDATSTYLPFRILRPLSRAHAASKIGNVIPIHNRDIITDYSIQCLTTILAATIYSVTLYAAYATFLPVSLVSFFDDIPSIAAAHSASIPSLLPLSLILGIASRSFIFTPATAALPYLKDAREAAFDPIQAGLWEHIVHNFWGWSTRTKIVLGRTFIVMILSATTCFVQTYFTIEGVAYDGAVGYAIIWAVAGVITGLSLGVVGAV